MEKVAAAVTAADILFAIRKKHYQGIVIREVTIADDFEQAIWARYKMESREDGDLWADYYRQQNEKRGIPVADAVPDGWDYWSAKFTRRIDALLIDKSSRVAIEIKVSRADFKRETEEKRRAWRAVTHKFVYAAPIGMLAPDEIPEGCGLWEFDPAASGFGHWSHGITVAVRGKRRRDPDPLPDALTRTLLGRLSRYEYEREAPSEGGNP